MPKYCIFCGNPPKTKTKEHVLPQWLLSHTGDPSRSVNMGYDYLSESYYNFSWSSLTAPACEQCNNTYSTQEEKIKKLVTKIENREELDTRECISLLDWFDKVRVGLWLNYNLLTKNIANISPNFFIEQRTAAKDRMLAIYPFNDNPNGLNAFGSESLVFQLTPSCISVRINNTVYLNISSDFLFARNCGFPSPNNMYIDANSPGTNLLKLSDIQYRRRVKGPLLQKPIYKPALQFYQPIIKNKLAINQESNDIFDSYLADSYMLEHCLENQPGHGCIFTEYNNRPLAITNSINTVKWSNVLGKQTKSLGEIAAQTYLYQNYLHHRIPTASADRDYRRYVKKNSNLFALLNRKHADSILQNAG